MYFITERSIKQSINNKKRKKKICNYRKLDNVEIIFNFWTTKFNYSKNSD